MTGQGLDFHYRAHGLDISSEIEFPEASPRAPGAADAIIRYGAVPPSIGNAVACGTRHRIAPGECLLDFPGVARFWVRAGREVTVAPEPGASAEDLRAGILSNVMGALVYQHGLFPLHASAVDLGGECVLFMGASGAGKSTLAAACHARGLSVYSDDLSAIAAVGHTSPMVHPGYRVLKLCDNSLNGLGPALGGLRSLAVRLGKQHIALPQARPLPALPVRAIFAITPGAEGVSALSPLQGADKIRLLLRETYRRRMFSGLGRQADHFTLAARIARDTPVSLLPRPDGLAGVLRLVDQLGELAPARRRTP
ncbi:hypothetical protein D0B54_11710 [Solimonas sp. K1W22B-7]|uniref:hypothetical protein n=1 Tax=Solimonas sp. K1W22B-7 TaxID=2303331 RepID=UPI000E331AEB|nr:hypothetical protein [Solimonas sp. K1W22B-7]AXQ29314.1 hypothetical protein D0B54_11710 [Solimonas sp. K1W22B-7]